MSATVGALGDAVMYRTDELQANMKKTIDFDRELLSRAKCGDLRGKSLRLLAVASGMIPRSTMNTTIPIERICARVGRTFMRFGRERPSLWRPAFSLCADPISSSQFGRARTTDPIVRLPATRPQRASGAALIEVIGLLSELRLCCRGHEGVSMVPGPRTMSSQLAWC
jgi:hypothetical protein